MTVPDPPNQITTRELTTEEMWTDLNWLCAELERRGHDKVDIAFRFAWNSAMENELGEVAMTVPPAEIAEHVRAMEASGDGALGSDDFWIEVEDVAINFCHESDIHCEFAASNEFVKSLYAHWQEGGAGPKVLTWCGGDDPAEYWKVGAVNWKPLNLA